MAFKILNCSLDDCRSWPLPSTINYRARDFILTQWSLADIADSHRLPMLLENPFGGTAVALKYEKWDEPIEWIRMNTPSTNKKTWIELCMRIRQGQSTDEHELGVFTKRTSLFLVLHGSGQEYRIPVMPYLGRGRANTNLNLVQEQWTNLSWNGRYILRIILALLSSTAWPNYEQLGAIEMLH